ncbi:MAG: hypothetical protein JWQ74_3508 [Marmoricola sp.]|nr:hypothetical protein [Marmoricola sp.]
MLTATFESIFDASCLSKPVEHMFIIDQTDFKQGWKVFISTTAVVIGLTAAWSGSQELKTHDWGHLYLISIPLVIACIAGLIYLARHKLVLTDQALWQYGFVTKCLPLAEIESVSENLGAYLIKSAKRSINITTDLHHQLAFKNHLLARLQALDVEKNTVPGKRLGAESQQKLFEQIQHMVDRARQEDAMLEVDASIVEQLSEPVYYIVYEHLVHDFLNRAYDTESRLVQAFITERIALKTAPGMTFFILPHHLEWLLVCLNDGDLVFTRFVE